MRLAILAVAAAFAASPAAAQTLNLTGRDGKTASVSAQALGAMPHVRVQTDQHGQKHDFEGVPLADLLSQVGVSVAKPLGGRDLAGAVRVTGEDGYQVVLALSEIDPATRKGRVLIADRDAGKPLGADTGPFRLVVEDDLRPARSARHVVRIEVLDLATKAK